MIALAQLLNYLYNIKCSELLFIDKDIGFFLESQKTMLENNNNVLFDNSKPNADQTNSFILSNGSELFLTDLQWDLLHKLGISLGKVSIDTSDIRKPQSSLSITHFVDIALESLLSINQTKIHEMFKKMFITSESLFLVKSSIIKTIEDALYSCMNKTRNKKNPRKPQENILNLKLNYTSFAHQIGNVVFDTWASSQVTLNKITLDLRSGYISYKNIGHLNINDNALLEDIYKALLKKDYKAFGIICNNFLNIQDKKIIKLLITVFEYLLYKHYKSHLITNPIILQMALNHFSDFKVAAVILIEYKKAMISLGSCILEHLTQAGLFIESSPSHTKDNTKLRLVSEDIARNLFANARLTKAFLTHSNISYLKKELAKQEKSINHDAYNIIYEQHYNRVQPHKDLTLVISNSNTLDNIKQTYFSIDREYLSVYLYILMRTLVEKQWPDVVNYFNMFKIDINAIKNLSNENVFQKDFNAIVKGCLD